MQELWVGLHLGEDPEAVHFRHDDVQEDRVERFGLEQIEGLPAIRRGGHPVALLFEPLRQGGPGHGIVLGHQDRGRFGHEPVPGRRATRTRANSPATSSISAGASSRRSA